MRYCNTISTFNWSPAMSKNPAVYLYIHIVIVIIVMNDSLRPLIFILRCTLMQYINSTQFYFLQFIGSVCKMPVGEDGDFGKKSVIALKNRYKDKFPCKCNRGCLVVH